MLGLLPRIAEERPLVCLVDDAQWLDRASAQILAFVARRLPVESMASVFAVRNPGEEVELGNLPVMVIGGLNDSDARALLESVVPGRLDERVRDRIVGRRCGARCASTICSRARPSTTRRRCPIARRSTAAIAEATGSGRRPRPPRVASRPGSARARRDGWPASWNGQPIGQARSLAA